MDQVVINEVGLRDGLQNQPTLLATADKLRLALALQKAGLDHLEVTSFVSPRAIPQMADADELSHALFAASTRHQDYAALVPNLRGYERALRHPYRELSVVVASTDSFNRHNLNKSLPEALDGALTLIGCAREDGVRLRVHLSGAMGCPYDGAQPIRHILDLAETLLAAGADELVLSDTIGSGHPRLARALLLPLIEGFGVDRLGLHLHDTRGLALPIALVAIDLGLRRFDASVGGLGGCPYAPGATGNVATESLVYLCEREGLRTGVDLEALQEAIALAASLTAQNLGGPVSRWLQHRCPVAGALPAGGLS